MRVKILLIVCLLVSFCSYAGMVSSFVWGNRDYDASRSFPMQNFSKPQEESCGGVRVSECRHMVACNDPQSPDRRRALIWRLGLMVLGAVWFYLLWIGELGPLKFR